MTFLRTAILLGMLALLPVSVFAGGNVIEQVTDGVCQCLQECKDDNISIQGKELQSCIQKVAKPYVKQLKKMYLDKDDPNAQEKFAEKLSMQLSVAMSNKCPDMLEFILEEFPELQDN